MSGTIIYTKRYHLEKTELGGSYGVRMVLVEALGCGTWWHEQYSKSCGVLEKHEETCANLRSLQLLAYKTATCERQNSSYTLYLQMYTNVYSVYTIHIQLRGLPLELVFFDFVVKSFQTHFIFPIENSWQFLTPRSCKHCRLQRPPSFAGFLSTKSTFIQFHP